MSLKIVYYEVESFGIQVTYDDCDSQRQYDFFKSFHAFNAWMTYEMYSYKRFEVTDANYDELRAKGVIS